MQGAPFTHQQQKGRAQHRQRQRLFVPRPFVSLFPPRLASASSLPIHHLSTGMQSLNWSTMGGSGGVRGSNPTCSAVLWCERGWQGRSPTRGQHSLLLERSLLLVAARGMHSRALCIQMCHKQPDVQPQNAEISLLQSQTFCPTAPTMAVPPPYAQLTSPFFAMPPMPSSVVSLAQPHMLHSLLSALIPPSAVPFQVSSIPQNHSSPPCLFSLLPQHPFGRVGRVGGLWVLPFMQRGWKSGGVFLGARCDICP